MWLYRLLCGLSCCLLLACQPEQAAPQWGHDAYIWQRAWRPALLQAVQEGGALFQQWRVLGLEGDARSGSWYRVKVNAAALQRSAHPVWLVVRMNGALGQYNEADTLRTIMDTLAQWQSLGIPLAGLEIDHDCGENSLPAYTRFLQTLRQQLKGKLPLSITMLPAWLDSAQLGHIIAASDQRVLQVHAVQNPRKGLFHPQQAEDWIRRLSRSTDQPFRVALPSYGSMVSFDDWGNLVGIESEARTGVTGAQRQELIVPPAQVAALLQRLRQDPPKGLSGFVWFRLPTREDQRAWQLSTLQAVIHNQPLLPRIRVGLTARDRAGLHDVTLINDGNVDAPLPAMLEAPYTCGTGDGIGPYRAQEGVNGLLLQRQQAGLLRPGQRLNIGWLRCSAPPSSLIIHD
ncbi:DUF3142 domain-containing protein [Leeia sp.]|uniref:DUF3142 domain-containing protein n=1 Tax=Leeia sp. TaxID=2884678 RepID=UPI0035B2FE51